METRVVMEEEVPVVRRGHLVRKEIEALPVSQVLLGHRALLGTMGNLDPKEHLVFQEIRVNMDLLENQGYLDVLALMGRRANQENQV